MLQMSQVRGKPKDPIKEHVYVKAYRKRPKIVYGPHGHIHSSPTNDRPKKIRL
jgi:hypothetical protein